MFVSFQNHHKKLIKLVPLLSREILNIRIPRTKPRPILRGRTEDVLVANQVLSQLSYRPINQSLKCVALVSLKASFRKGPGRGLNPLHSNPIDVSLKSRDIHLLIMERVAGIEPAKTALEGQGSTTLQNPLKFNWRYTLDAAVDEVFALLVFPEPHLLLLLAV